MEKVEGGKLLVIKVDFGDKIEKVDITGDFFAHPEESIKEIEKRLAGIKKDFDEKEIAEELQKVIAEKGYQLIGLDAAAIARVLKKAVDQK
ncbi:hypothetical protein QT06_C0001G0125 [archaeon GW2011_AR15]|nr:hypothetical protein QT06_C0001G0125 [archaeon GW2011_AR15]